MKTSNMTCIICGNSVRNLNDSQMKVIYDVCEECGFVYKQPKYHISNEKEFEEYSKHNNSFEVKGYVDMFRNLIDEFIKPLDISGKGLEFGSGPGPVLKELLIQLGFHMFDYDPYFNPNEEYMNHNYELITSTEVIEHLANPKNVFSHLKSLLSKNGYLVLMTNFNTFNDKDFLTWWYRRDKTHISFYRLKTLEYLADLNQLEVVTHNNKNIIVLKNKTF